MRISSIKSRWWVLAALLILPALALSLAAPQSNSLSVAGQPGTAKVIQVDGRNYVDVESLARLTKSSVSFNGNQIVLTLPPATADTTTVGAPRTGFSKDFVTSGIEAMAQIREWRTALKNAIERSLPLSLTSALAGANCFVCKGLSFHSVTMSWVHAKS
jgi:hypothetical protein